MEEGEDCSAFSYHRLWEGREDGGVGHSRGADRPFTERWRTVLLGEYDWKVLCTPSFPWSGKRRQAPFYGKDEKIPILLALVMGLQHALAMVGGIITAPLIISSPANGNFTPSEQQYLVSAALIISGFASFIQVTQIRIPYTRYVIGSGMLSVMGTTFSFLPVTLYSIATLRSCACDGVPCDLEGTCESCLGSLSGSCYTGQAAYGHILGTMMVCSGFQVVLSLCPSKYLQKIFPPVVTGSVIILIGVSLIGSGFSQWGGGSFCASQVLTSKVSCDGNGEVVLPFGHKYYLGLGLVVFSTLVMVELFGSPFLRNTQVVVGLLVGLAVASVVHVTKCAGSTCTHLRFITGSKISDAPWITFLWKHRFPLGFYAPAVLPMLFAYMVSAMEAIGDVSATYEASRLEPFGMKFDRSVQGAILADGLNSLLAGFGTVTPVVTYAQNNGVISLSGCASRRAGYACCVWLIFLGIFAKFSATIVSIPNCVLGAMTTFLFSSVVVSGIQVLISKGVLSRRSRFIVIMALGIGLGVNLVPAWINITGQSEYPNEGNFWPVNDNWSTGYKGFRDALIILLSNGFSVGGLIAIFLNLLLPTEEE